METGGIRRRFEAYMDLSDDIDNQIARLEEMELAALSPSAPFVDGMPGPKGTPGDRVGRSVAARDALQARLDRMIAKERTEGEALEAMLESLSARERYILQRRYFDRRSWDVIADKAALSVRGCQNIEKRAFEKLEDVYGE